MAQFWRTFDSDTLDQTPAGMTPRLFTSGVTWQVKEDAGGRFVRRVATSTGDTLLALDEAGQVSNVEILVQARSSVSANGLQIAAAGRAAGPGGAFDGTHLHVQLNGNADPTLRSKRFSRRLAGTFSTWSTQINGEWTADTWYWLLLRIGNLGAAPDDIRAKIWSGLVTDEPAEWDRINSTGASGWAAGYAGLFSQESGANQDFRVLSIGTGGDTAPRQAIFDPADLDVIVTGTTAALSWTASPTAGVIDYSVFRRTPPTGAVFDPQTDTPIASGVTGTTYDDTGLSAGEFEYQVFGRTS